jgi:protease-4
MGKFLLGILTGVILVVLVAGLGIFALATLKSRPASVADGSTLVLRLSGDVPEKPPVEIPFPMFEQRASLTVQNVWEMLRHAASDSRIRAVAFEPEGASVGWAKMQEIRADIEAFRKSGKPVWAYLKTPSSRDYYMATACSRIYIQPADTLDLKGVGLELMYFKNTLDKLGVQVEVEHAGKYKDFGDMFTRTNMSPETKEVLNSIADDVYGDLVNNIAKGRDRDPASIRATIDRGPFRSVEAKNEGLVDAIRYEDEFFGELKDNLKQTAIKKLDAHDYAAAPDSSVTNRDKVAWVVAEGSITRGDPDSSDGDGIESASFVKTLNKVANDSSIKAVVVRIDSPGGEVTASDELWRGMNELRRKKPVVISMSDAAASGGYYMAMTGDPIVAYPATETGSVGVVFGKPNLHGLYDKVGITKDYITRGKFALIESDYEALGEEGRKKLKDGIDATYEEFVAKVAAARHRNPAEIEPLAQGRVWLGDQAKQNGLVDELGGIDAALNIAKKKAGIPASSRVSLVLYPGKRSVFDLLFHSQSDAEADVLLRRAGLEGVREVWKDDRLRVWMRGGMLRMMPFTLNFR